MADEVIRTEQTEMDLSTVPGETESVTVYNVFRPDYAPDKRKVLIEQHKNWLNCFPKEYPMPTTPYRIGVYIRYFNQTKYENYLDYHKKEFQDTISLCPLWTLVDFYTDTGSTAPNMSNSPELCRLSDDCFSGKVNLIVTQKIKNISRSPEDLSVIARLLAAQEKPVGFYFISEDIFTLASYYTWDLRETGFLPEDWKPLPDDERKTPRLTGGNHVE